MTPTGMVVAGLVTIEVVRFGRWAHSHVNVWLNRRRQARLARQLAAAQAAVVERAELVEVANLAKVGLLRQWSNQHPGDGEVA